ncbi:MAG: TIGR02678 family protein [Anaeromicrobium sp.]|jgi:uncharacterized protein (TIGR02678 family)|uniref:TIGR02678 family protein n=1 Tax=Anaeromicrobium sp. TaxID=1929132 RepID=UPI0025D944AF|nr:TIGR02678 family protein [Anaeromicrobium sp.]MCT4594238.1 TIGR02678 family protein [Anaeromicrobium sp.]
MKGLDILLENYWIRRNDDKEKYYGIKNSLDGIKDFLSEKLSYQLIINSQIIKLEKIPGKAESWMGIKELEHIMEYVFLCQVLMFLEDKDKEEQFLLSELTDYIEGTFMGDEKIDWTLYKQRRYLIKVLRFVVHMGIIKVNDGEDKNFANSQDSEVLYENTGISHYFMRNFIGNIMDYTSIKDLEEDELLGADKDKGRMRRNRVYRRLVMSPGIYNDGAYDHDYNYIKNYRGMIQKDMEKYLECEVHIHKNGTFLIAGEDKYYKDVFPSNRAISDVVLLFNHHLISMVKEGQLKRNEKDIIFMDMNEFYKNVVKVKEVYGKGFSKEYRDMKIEKLRDEILKYMESFLMINITNNNLIMIMPIIGKITGKYPKDFMLKE